MSGADQKNTVRTLYIMLMIGSVLPVLSLVTVIMAYVYRSEAGAVLQSHYLFIIYTFWISLACILIGIATWNFGFGWMIFAIWFFWLFARCIKGFMIASKNQPHPKPNGWLID